MGRVLDAALQDDCRIFLISVVDKAGLEVVTSRNLRTCFPRS